LEIIFYLIFDILSAMDFFQGIMFQNNTTLVT